MCWYNWYKINVDTRFTNLRNAWDHCIMQRLNRIPDLNREVSTLVPKVILHIIWLWSFSTQSGLKLATGHKFMECFFAAPPGHVVTEGV